ncbi:MAG: PHP domain-containing protein [Chlorobium sp.]|uniref:PHP domain-containing protein n=1 Tax=Chlorobium sp. TaxID=1095 RepID=UPI001DB9734D|nr:PHP domain-containing protein [Chlorobium sp.]MBN1278563.1 PHP domain-containing protein [Chlorobiaceae bacterium]MCF8216853.1 PHP domain-containing protein [Chlorobium sp.]MCF8271698.1 PHP domain-containing protein [Chlorobium sp.]MCF8288070.1 PHP domain-containing protein [Chlorobium sp.]MCF8291654.1 PHP domain-containing protein [Chlorobium sp.]
MPYSLESVGHNGFEKADLHIHTKCSDGIFSPEEIVVKASVSGLSAISITDHDSVSGIDKAKPLALVKGIELIPGVEMSSTYKDYDIHILGYFFDYKHSELKRYLDHCRHLRTERAERMVGKLARMGVKIGIEEIILKAQNGSVGRPHIAAVLQDGGYVKSFSEAFSKYLGAHSPAYVKSIETHPADVIRLINEASGLSFLAHPAQNVPDEILKQLITFGLDGIEIVHPSHDAYKQNYYREIANEYFLLFSGGSDFHGLKERDDETFGTINIPYEWVIKMKSRLVKA